MFPNRRITFGVDQKFELDYEKKKKRFMDFFFEFFFEIHFDVMILIFYYFYFYLF